MRNAQCKMQNAKMQKRLIIFAFCILHFAFPFSVFDMKTNTDRGLGSASPPGPRLFPRCCGRYAPVARSDRPRQTAVEVQPLHRREVRRGRTPSAGSKRSIRPRKETLTRVAEADEEDGRPRGEGKRGVPTTRFWRKLARARRAKYHLPHCPALIQEEVTHAGPSSRR